MSSSEYSDDRDSDSVESEDLSSPDIRVCIRLRPMNKLEASRRSKNCVEFHDDPHVLTVDSPLEGEFDFGFDRVFDEYASQIEVFEHAVSPVAANVLEGYNCTVMAYGQTGSGKTHTMMGVGGSSCRPLDKSGESNGSGTEAGIGAKPDIQGQGMIPRTIGALFALMEKSSPAIEYTIRCSYVEIYLEKLLDLLNPHGSGDVPLSVVDDGFTDEAAGSHNEGSRIVGASELCCVNEEDVFSLLERGNACRTVSSTNMNTDSSRSHAVFIIKVEQRNAETNEVKNSVLHMVDLAGSEMAENIPQYAASQQNNQNAVQAETKMVSKSLATLTNVVRAQMKRQKGANVQYPASSRLYKLTRLLRPCFGGNCMTTIILTASPSSYNIGETISAIRFGQCCRRIKNQAIVNVEHSSDHYRKQLALSERKQSELKMLVKALAVECQSLKSEGLEGSINEDNHSGPLWDSIEEVLSEDDNDDSDYVVVVRRGGSAEDGIDGSSGSRNRELQQEMNADLESHDNMGSSIAELKSEVAVLRTQNENLSSESKKVMQELIDAKNEIQVISQRKIEVEHNLRTSQFRENEATVFLRQFRRFYRRLLRNKASQGSGATQEITAKTPGVPDLNDLIDVDTLLVESGLIEEDEMHDETTAGTYRPSGAALLRSTAAAKKAGKQAKNALERDSSNAAFSVSAHSETSEDEASSANESSSRVGLADTAHSTRSLDKISETDGGGISQKVDDSAVGNENFEDSTEIGEKVLGQDNGGGADAGAGAGASSDTIHVDPLDGSDSVSSSRKISGASIADRQRVLRTPAGRLLAAKEKELERDFLKMTERCIELQMALDEEKANSEALANRSGTFGKKREAQEAIALRKQIDQKTHDLQAIIWKMNELHLINKTYNDKMANREQHVAYLEENLADMQNTNKRLMQEQQESEKKLREELESMRILVDGVTVPLWQFGEEGTMQRPVASRIVVPAVVGDRRIDVGRDVPTRRVSEGASEPSLDFEGEVTDEIENAHEMDGTSEDDGSRHIGDRGDGIVNDFAAKNVELADATTQTEDKEETQVQAPAATVETVTAQTQTIVMETTEISVQTDSLPVEDTGEHDIDSKFRNSAVGAGIVAGAGAAAAVGEYGAGGEPHQAQSRAVGPSEAAIETTNAVPEHDRAGTMSDGAWQSPPLSNGRKHVDGSSDEDKSDSESEDDASPDTGHSSSRVDDGADMQNGVQEDRRKRASFTAREVTAQSNPVAATSDPTNSLYLGGKPADHKPRQFVKKLGPSVKAGVLKDCRKKSSEKKPSGRKKKPSRSSSQRHRGSSSSGRPKRSKSVR